MFWYVSVLSSQSSDVFLHFILTEQQPAYDGISVWKETRRSSNVWTLGASVDGTLGTSADYIGASQLPADFR